MDVHVSEVYVSAFNELLASFVGELTTVFPGEKKIRVFNAGLPTLVASHRRKALDLFAEAVRDNVPAVLAKDPAVFDRMDALGMDFARLWKEDLSDGTREAIWDYLITLTEYAALVDARTDAAVRAVAYRKVSDDREASQNREHAASQAVQEASQTASQGASQSQAAEMSALFGALQGQQNALVNMAAECTKKIVSGDVDVSGLMDSVFADAPPELMQSIESLAAECAEKMQSGDTNMEAMMARVMGQLQTMDLSFLENVEPAKLTNMLGGLGLDAGMVNLASSLGGLTGGADESDELLQMLERPRKKKKQRRRH